VAHYLKAEIKYQLWDNNWPRHIDGSTAVVGLCHTDPHLRGVCPNHFDKMNCKNSNFVSCVLYVVINVRNENDL